MAKLAKKLCARHVRKVSSTNASHGSVMDPFSLRMNQGGKGPYPPIVQTLPLVGLGKEGSLFLVVVLGAQAFTLSLARPLSIAIIAVSAAVLKGR